MVAFIGFPSHYFDEVSRLGDQQQSISKQVIRKIAGPLGETWLRRGLVILLVAVALLIAFRWLPIVSIFFESKQMLGDMGMLGILLFIGVFTVVSVFLMPRAVMSFSSGALFGLWWGFGAAIIGATLGACAAFIVCRFAIRKQVEKMLEGNHRFAALDRAVRRQGFKVVLLTRLSPIFPANVMNYAYGVMRVRLKDYAIATGLGMMPTTFVSVALGAAAAEAAVGNEPDLGNVQLVVSLIALVATAAVSVVLARIAKGVLEKETEGAVLTQE